MKRITLALFAIVLLIFCLGNGVIFIIAHANTSSFSFSAELKNEVNKQITTGRVSDIGVYYMILKLVKKSE